MGSFLTEGSNISEPGCTWIFSDLPSDYDGNIFRTRARPATLQITIVNFGLPLMENSKCFRHEGASS